jgi:hypothetical protein
LQIVSGYLLDGGDRTSALKPAKNEKLIPTVGIVSTYSRVNLPSSSTRLSRARANYRNWLGLCSIWPIATVYAEKRSGCCDGQMKVKREYPAAPFILASYGKKGISGKAVSKIFKAASAAIALPEELVYPHVLRHTRGYLMVEKGTF